MIIRHSNRDINQSVQHEPTHDPNNGRFQNLRRSSLLQLPTAGYTSSTGTSILDEVLACIGQRIGCALLQPVDQDEIYAANLQNEVVGVS